MILPDFDESTALLAVFDGHGGTHTHTHTHRITALHNSLIHWNVT